MHNGRFDAPLCFNAAGGKFTLESKFIPYPHYGGSVLSDRHHWRPPNGLTGHEKALQWGLHQFKKAGLSEAYLQDYRASRNWLPGVEQGYVVSGQVKHPPLRLAAMPFSAPTPEKGLQADVYAIDAR